MFTIKGKLKRREYYQLYFWENKSNFYVTILLTFLVSVVSFNHISIAQTILGGDWILVLIDWIKLLIFGLVFMFVIMMTDAGIRKKVLLKDKEYIFSDEKITIQTSKSETYILWNKVTKIKETKHYQLIEIEKKTYLLLPNHFFENEKEMNEFRSFIKSKVKEQSD